MKLARNSTVWAVGTQKRQGFYIRRVVWGYLMACAERRDGEQIRAATIMIERAFKKRPDLMRTVPAQGVGNVQAGTAATDHHGERPEK